MPWLSIGEGQDTELFWDYLTVKEYDFATITMGTVGSKPGKQKQSTGDSTKKGYDSTAEQENPLQTETHLKLSPKKGEKYCTLI